MKQRQDSWLTRPDVPVFWMVIVAILITSALFFIQTHPVGMYLDRRIAQPVEFRLRHYLGKDAKLAENMKIIALDDRTFHKMESWVPPIEQWALILKKIDEKKPKAIFIDMSWQKIVDPNQQKAFALDILSQLKTPVILGSMVRMPHKNYTPLDLDGKTYRLSQRMREEQDLPFIKTIAPAIVMGAHPDIREHISAIGHFQYSGDGKVHPSFRLGFDTILPHVFTFLVDDWRFQDKNMMINDKKVPLDSEGMLPVNFIYPHEMYKKAISLRYYLNKIESGEPDQKIDPGDVVAILPHFYSGNTDFKWTPFGDVPAGIVPVSLLNSVVTGHWIKPVHSSYLLILLMVGLGIFGAVRFSPVVFWLWNSGFSFFFFAGVLSGFVYFDLHLNWLVPYNGFLISGFVIYVKKIRSTELKTRALRQALQGTISEDNLKDLLKKPQQVNLEPRERVVTLMFIDIVGFSLLSQHMVPRKVFDSLKETIDRLTSIIHKHQGVVDKTLGDGLLCYFGYSFEGDASYSHHAEYALKAAKEIQIESAKMILKASESGEPMMPLRIGINTASCFIGDLGHEGRIEFTVIGNGVNFAKRLEGACSKYQIMMSKTTKELINETYFQAQFLKLRNIKIKHHNSEIQVFEFNPIEDKSLVNKLHGLSEKRIGIEGRKESRVELTDNIFLAIKAKSFTGMVSNMSATGLSFRSKQKIHFENKFNFQLECLSLPQEQQIQLNSIKMIGKSKWVFEEEGEFVYGLTFVNVEEGEGDMVFHLISKLLKDDYQKEEIA